MERSEKGKVCVGKFIFSDLSHVEEECRPLLQAGISLIAKLCINLVFKPLSLLPLPRIIFRRIILLNIIHNHTKLAADPSGHSYWKGQNIPFFYIASMRTCPVGPSWLFERAGRHWAGRCFGFGFARKADKYFPKENPIF